MQLYVDAQNGTDTAGQGTSWATAYATPDFAIEDLWNSHGRDTTVDTNGDTINCFGVFSFASTMTPSVSPLPNQSRRVTFVSRGRNSIDDGLRCEWRGDNGCWDSNVIEYVGWIGFYFTFGLSGSTPSDKCMRVDRACWFADCVFDGRGVVNQTMVQWHWNNYAIDCQFINMYSSVGSMSIGGQWVNCYSSATAGRSSNGFTTYRNGGIYNCTVLIDHQSAGSGFNMLNSTAGAVIVGNTGVNIGIKGYNSFGIRVTTEPSLIADNYVENATSAIGLANANYYLKDNYYFDCTSATDGGSYSNNILGNFNTITELSSAMYTDPENGDWTIANPQAIARREMPYGGLEYWGAVQQIQPQKNGYNPFGGL